MFISYPTSLDSFTNPASSSLLTSPDHAQQHTDANNAIAALEAKVGVTGSAVTTTVDYKLTSASSVDPGHKHTSASLTDLSTIVPTGSILPYGGSSAPTNFLLCDGSTVSRSTYATLFGVIGTTFGAGNGSTTFGLPDMRGRTVVGVGTGTKVATVSSRATDTLTVTGITSAANNEFQTGQAVTYHTTGSVMTGLTNDTVYYVIRVTNTTFKVASSLANAQNGTQVSLSSDGTGTHTFTQTLTARTLGDTGGEENHAMSSTELLAHSHTAHFQSGSTSQAGASAMNNTQDGSTGSTGGNAAMNAMQPFVALNYIIRT